MAIIQPNGEQTYIGKCLSTHTWYNSSMDVTSYYVNVYNPDTNAFESIYVNDDFPSDSPKATYTIDATSEVVAIWEAKQKAIRDAEYARRELERIMRVEIGKRVQVYKGRKVAKGTEGIVFWMGDTGYGTRVGIKDASGTVHWTAETNVQVI